MGRQPNRRPVGAGASPPRSIRVADDTWEAAKRRANYEGITLSSVVQTILEGYAKGRLDLPEVTVHYEQVATK